GEDLQREVTKRGGRVRPDQFDGALERDVLVVLPHRSLPGWGVDRFGQAVAVTEPCRKCDPADALRGLVFLPATAAEVAAHHALDREHVKLLDEHRPPFDGLRERGWRGFARRACRDAGSAR